MTDTVPLTEKLLMDAGGWREMKAARQIHAAGKVAEAEYRDGVLSGLVQDRGKPLRVRVRVRSATNLENACPCPLSRREGAICAHALAVGLEILDPKGPSAAPPETAIETPGASTAAKTAAADDPWPAMTELATDDAEPARLFVVIPPNLAGAWERDRAMAGIEVELAGKRALLASAGKDRTLFLDARDAPLWQALKSLSPDAVPGMLALPRAAFLRLLDALAGHPRVGFGRDRAATIEVRPFRPALRMKDFTLRVDWPAGVVPLCEAGAEVAWVLDGDTFRPVAPGLPAGMRPVFGEGLRLDPALAVPVLEALEEFFEVPAETRAGLPEVLVPSVILDLEGSLNHLEATLRFDYADGARVRPAGSGKAEPVEVAAAPDRVFVTDPAFERRAAARLESLGFAGPDAGGRFALKDKPAILHFFAHGCSRLDPSWKTSAGERFAHARTKVEPVSATFDFQPGGGENWFAMAVEFATPAGEAIPRQEIQRLLQMGQNARALPNGRFAVLDPALVDDLSEAVADCDPRQARPGLFEIDHRHAAYLRETAEASGVAVSGKAPWTRAPAEKLAFGDLGDLAATLRPYQAEGVAWLQSLAERGMGGILADDMGLGKTLQTLAFLKSADGPSLVVCPSSLVGNWMAEAAKFVPSLKAVAIDGPSRMETLAAEGDTADLLVTSYALMRLDIDAWRGREFATVVLDEAQHIKNPDAQVTKAVNRLRARRRLALTGTPIENSVRDLWSIVNFVLPGYLGGRKEFAERFEKPLAAGSAPALQERLARRLKPIVKRRLKREVAADLPERLEQTHYCDLTPKQRAVYRQILDQSRATLLDAEGGRKRMLALTALLRLRQACCDLRLLGLRDIGEADASAKLDALGELLAEAVAGGHRVLVFSQFVEMLQGLVPRLHQGGHAYCYLDGKTRNRSEVVAKFQNDPAIPVFLISLKAGGVGLNLTGADTVIHLDPWWNPAVEAQATDRAHRIGQRRVVTAYKLIARDTVEEKILALQERKKAATAALLDTDLGSAGSGLSEMEILELFE